MIMGLFWKRSKHKPLSARQEKAAGRIASVIIRRQTEIAGYLNRKTQYWNRASKLILLLLICLVFGGVSLWLLLRACN
ncbi:hypothetical protein [Mucilaginibacter sp. L3T2-6]|nr:hypothetical protein [Mucilaginibacter sp. L3T2-6]MDO3641514.1 hypothetical protein [Mucilaginibacter sp. L3T2-6]